MAGIELASNFDLGSQLPLDSRTRVADISARNAIPSTVRYEGLITYVLSAETNYQLVGGILDANWQELSGNGSGAGGSTSTKKFLLVNNSVNTLSEIGDYLADCPGFIVRYYVYRRTETGGIVTMKTMSGEIRMETYPDEALSADKWKIFEPLRSENGGDSGVTFSLSEVDTGKSVLVASLDNMAGDNHLCKIYCEILKFSNDTGKIIILDNNSINPISSIGEFIADAGAVIVDFYIYRRTDLGFRTISGKLILEGNDEALTNADKWKLLLIESNENFGASGVTFSLDDIATEKSILVITLDNMAGSDHRCDFYYTKTVLAN